MSGFRKFGTSDDQKVSVEENDGQGVQKKATTQWTDKDAQRLAEENKADSQDR